jgi:hypothetical protein
MRLRGSRRFHASIGPMGPLRLTVGHA